MGSRVSTELAALLVHDRRVTDTALTTQGAGATNSSYTQAGPRPGTAVPADTKSTVLPRCHAAQDSDLDLQLIRGGDPGPDGLGVIYREDNEDAALYRGWNEPNHVTAYVPIDWTTTEAWTVVDAVTIPSTQKVCVVAIDNTGTTLATAWVWSPTTRTWSGRATFGAGAVYTRICACVIPQTERILAFCFIPAGTSKSFYSDDGGANWSEYRRFFWTGGSIADTTVDECTVEVDRYGNLLMVLTDNNTGDYWTFRSTDGGSSFTFVTNGTAWGNKPTLRRTSSGTLLLTYIAQATGLPKAIVLEDAYDTIAGKTAVSLDTDNTGYVRAVVDDDGTCYAVIMDGDSTDADQWRVARSTDDGATWTLYTQGAMQCGALANPGNRRYWPRAAACSAGEVVVAATPQMTATTPTTDDSLVSVVLGGWSNIEMPSSSATNAQSRILRFGYGYDGSSLVTANVWLPGETLANQGWTAAGTAETILGGYHRFNPAAATSNASVTFTNAGTLSHVFAEMRVVSGGSIGSGDAAIRVRRANGVYDYTVVIRASTTQYVLYDVNGAAQIGSTQNVDMTTDYVQFRIMWSSSGGVTVWHRARGSSVWLLGPSGAATNTPAGANDQIAVGALVAATVDVRYGMIGWSPQGLLNSTVDGAFGVNRLEWGKALAGAPYPVRDQGSATRIARLSVGGGGGRYGEAFQLDAVYDYGVDKLFPHLSPSPRSGWRSTQKAANERFVFDFGTPAGGNDTRLDPGWCLALAFVGAYVPRQITVSRKTNAAGAFTTLGTYDGATGFTTLDYRKDGDVIKCNPATPGTPGARYSFENAWVGGYAILNPTGTPLVRRIASNTPGVWTGASGVTTPQMELRLLDCDGTEPTTDKVHLVAPGGVLLIPQAVASVFRYLKVEVVNDPVYSTYFGIPKMVVGAAMVPGGPMGQGWSMRYVPRVRSREDDYGTVWTEKRGPLRRELTWSYQHGANLYGARNNTSAPDYVSLHSTLPAEAAHGDVEHRLAATLQNARGGATPAVAILRMPQVSTVTTITDPSLWVYGRLTGTLQANNVLGAPGVGEYGRIESLQLVELPWDTDG